MAYLWSRRLGGYFQDFGVYAGFPDLAAAYHYNPGQGNYVVKLEYGDPFPNRGSRPEASPHLTGE